jgi:flagellar hook assembly protein FlgD
MAIAPEVFSPDNDGYDDILSIGYEFKGPSYTGSVTIYDSNGRLVKYLVRNKLLGTEGNFSWNGINEENEKARIGIYVVYLEAFDLNGNVVKLKKAAVLGGRL